MYVHVHIIPTSCLFRRISDDYQVVAESVADGLLGTMLKCHHESTAERAYTLQGVANMVGDSV